VLALARHARRRRQLSSGRQPRRRQGRAESVQRGQPWLPAGALSRERGQHGGEHGGGGGALMATLTHKDAKRITAAVLGQAMAPGVVVSVRDRQTGNTRFARNEPTTAGDVDTLEISVTASIEGRTATAIGNRSDAASLAALVAEAEELAALSPVDPEHVPPIGKGVYLQVAGHDKATAKLGAAERSKQVEQAIAAAAGADVELAGFLEHREQSVAIATSAGAFAFYPSTEASLTVTCRSRDGQGSGWAGLESHRGAAIDAGAL